MLSSRIKKKGKKLESISQAVKKLDKQTVKAGYFASQGKHIDGEYSYVALAQALELGYFPLQEIVRIPMPFMKHIGYLAMRGMRNDPAVKREFNKWIKKADKKGNPQALLNAIGES